MAYPMPLAPPVIRTTLSWNGLAMIECVTIDDYPCSSRRTNGTVTMASIARSA